MDDYIFNQVIVSAENEGDYNALCPYMPSIEGLERLAANLMFGNGGDYCETVAYDPEGYGVDGEDCTESNCDYTVSEESNKREKTYYPELYCPWCGAQLVVRTNKKTGQRFLGCSGFPLCRFSISIDDFITYLRKI